MAEEEKQEEQTEESGGGGGGLKKLIFIIVGMLLVAIISVVATLFLLGGDDESAEMVDEDPFAEDVSAEVTQAMYLDLNPAFVVGFKSGGKTRYLKLDIAVLGRDQEALDAITTHMPLIRNNLIDLLNGQEYESLRDIAGRETLADELALVIQDVLTVEIGRPGIERVLFRNFVMQ